MSSAKSTVEDAMEVPQLVEGLAKIHGSVNAAARKCGMPEGTLHRLKRGERMDPRLSTLRLLARGYGESFIDFARRMDGDRDTHEPSGNGESV